MKLLRITYISQSGALTYLYIRIELPNGKIEILPKETKVNSFDEEIIYAEDFALVVEEIK